MREAPWIFGLATALWFGIAARRSGQGAIGWAIGGGLFGLITSTFVMGVNHAVFIPESQRDYLLFRVKEFVSTALILAVVGWLLTGGLHRQPERLWQAVKRKLGRPQKEAGQ